MSVGASVFLSWVHKTDGIKEHSPQLRPLLQYGMRRPNPFFKCSALLTCLDFAIHSSLADYKPYTSCFQMEANDRVSVKAFTCNGELGKTLIEAKEGPLPFNPLIFLSLLLIDKVLS